MRRTLFTLLAGFAITLLAPAFALAAHHRGHAASHHRHHARHASAHHSTASSATPAPVLPAAPPAAPHSEGSGTTPPAPEPSEVSGTVESFVGGVLILKLADGTTVSGQVTEATKLECEAAEDEGSESGEDGSGAPAGGGLPAAVHHSSDGTGEAPGSEDGEDGATPPAPAACTTAVLTAGAKVHEAELSGSGAAAIWTKVEVSL